MLLLHRFSVLKSRGYFDRLIIFKPFYQDIAESSCIYYIMLLHASHGYLRIFNSLDVNVFHWICGFYVFLIEPLESTSKKTNWEFIYYSQTIKIRVYVIAFTRSLPLLVSTIRLL